MKRSLITLFFIASSAFTMSLYAQSSVESFMADELADFNKFLDEANKEFVEFLRNPWKEETPKAAKKAIQKPKPKVVPQVSDKHKENPKEESKSHTPKSEFDWDGDEPELIKGKGGNVERIKVNTPT